MDRLDLKALQEVREYPAVSIFVRTHRTSPDNAGDPLRVKNAVKEATDRLLMEFSKREAAPLVAELERIVEEIDYPHTLDTLAIFASGSITTTVYLPYEVPERVVVDETFATRDLVRAVNRAQRYWLLAISEQPTRLYQGLADQLEEFVGGGLPMTHNGPGGAIRLPGGFGINSSRLRDDAQRQFLRAVDAAIGPAMAADPLPLIVAGIDRNLAFFREVTQHEDALAGTVTGSFERTPLHELATLAAPVVQDALRHHRDEQLEALERAVSAQRYASGIDDAWRMAHEGRVHVLMVEDGFHYPATITDGGMRLLPAEDAAAPGVLDDAVDELVEAVLARGGRVHFYSDGRLEAHRRVAAILRF